MVIGLSGVQFVTYKLKRPRSGSCSLLVVAMFIVINYVIGGLSWTTLNFLRLTSSCHPSLANHNTTFFFSQINCASLLLRWHILGEGVDPGRPSLVFFELAL